MKKTRRMYRLRKLGLFVSLKLPAPPKKTAATTAKQRSERKPTIFHSKGELNFCCPFFAKRPSWQHYGKKFRHN